jgi:hypothetical protein
MTMQSTYQKRMQRIDRAMGAAGFVFAVLIVVFWFTGGGQ